MQNKHRLIKVEMEFHNIRKILSTVRRAVEKYNMIEEGDRIAVGVSGGKDSLVLLTALHGLKRFYPKSFELHAITVSMGFDSMDFSPIKHLCNTLNIPYTVVQTELAHVIFDVRRESNPCSLCAKMRRGMLHDAAKEVGCNKIALGHHYDDVIDTFMLNLFNEGRLGAFLPVTYLSRKDITMIRPLIYLPEDEIAAFSSENSLPIVKNPCPEDGHTERESLHKMIEALENERAGLKKRIFGAVEKGGLFDMQESSVSSLKDFYR